MFQVTIKMKIQYIEAKPKHHIRITLAELVLMNNVGKTKNKEPCQFSKMLSVTLASPDTHLWIAFINLIMI